MVSDVSLTLEFIVRKKKLNCSGLSFPKHCRDVGKRTTSEITCECFELRADSQFVHDNIRSFSR